MTRYDADLEVIKGLRAALLVFVGQQTDALQAVERHIAMIVESLEEAEQRWHSEVGPRRQALQNCRLAQLAVPIDCSKEEADLREAEEKLTEIGEWKYRVREAVVEYHAASQRVSNALENEPPHACAFLDERITALEAYQGAISLPSQQNSPSAPSIAPLTESKETKPSVGEERGASNE
jgi:hypothetical protein